MDIFEEIERNTRMRYQHRKELSQRGNDILQGVLCAMQLAEEIERHIDRTYTHRKELSQRANDILQGVLCAMQLAEEIEGVEGQDYLNLMGEIGKEASQRIVNFLSWHEENNRDRQSIDS